MRICTLVFLMLVGTYNISFAQKINNIWCFGYGAGLDFNSGVPVPFSGSVISAGEGSSTISDSNGNLLFYTDGLTIWNRNNNIMLNGNNLTGDPSSTQSALIVPKPGSPNLYYVFVTFSGLYYSVVDMTLNGGLGGVVSGQKNILLISNSGEKICGTPHANGTDVWIMSNEHGVSNGFNAFLLSSSGLNTTPVHSNSGLTNQNNGDYGQMKFTCKGDRVAFGIADQTSGQNNTIFVGDFDNSTGIVSNGYNLHTDLFQIYGIEFSPNGRYLYGGINYTLTQFDLNAGSPSAVQASSATVATSNSYPFDGLQLGPDNKIYMAGGGGTVSVVNNPDLGGTACNVSMNSVSLGSASVGLDFPSMVNYQCAQLLAPLAVTDTLQNVTCFDSCNGSARVNIIKGIPPYHILWLPGGDTTAAINNLCAGSYIVSVTDQADSLFTDTIVITSPSAIQVNVSAPHTSICSYDSVLVTATSGFVNYAWDVPKTGNAIEVNQTGSYYVTVTDNQGCKKESNHVVINVYQPPVATVSGENIFCAGDSVQLCVSANFNSYTWNSGQHDKCIYTAQAGNHYVTVTDANNCSAESNHFAVNAYPVSPIAITVSGDTLSSYGANSYSWYLHDSIIAQTASPIYIVTVPGEYKVSIVDSNGCTVISTPVDLSVTGINNISQQQIQVYPNPFNDEIHFTLQDPLQFVIRDDLGREIRSGTAKNMIETKDLLPGVYLLFLRNRENYFVVKMIKD